MRQANCGVEGVRVHIVLPLVHYDLCAGSNGVIAVGVMEGLIVYAALHSAGCIVCRPTEVGTTNLGGLAIYVSNRTATMCSKPPSLAYFPEFVVISDL